MSGSVMPDIVFPLPMRDGKPVMKLCGLPSDLTAKEAARAADALYSLRSYLLTIAEQGKHAG